MGLLVGAGPDVHVPIVEILALPIDRPVVAGHRLEDQVMGFPEPVHHAHRIGIGRRAFIGHALDEAHLQAAAGDDIDHRHFLGDADGIVAVAQRDAERQQARARGDPRQNGKQYIAGDIEARGRGVMLVDHDVEAEFIGEHPFIEVALVEAVGDLRVAKLVGKRDAQGRAIGRPSVGVGLFGEVVDAHGVAHRVLAAGNWRRKPARCSCTTAGRSRCGKCPAPGMISKRAPGTSAA